MEEDHDASPKVAGLMQRTSPDPMEVEDDGADLAQPQPLSQKTPPSSRVSGGRRRAGTPQRQQTSDYGEANIKVCSVIDALMLEPFILKGWSIIHISISKDY